MKKPLPLRKKLLATLIRSAVITAAFVPAMSWAQSSDATLRGKAAPEMQITAKNVATGTRRTTMTSADGSYALVGLPPGTYQVDAGPGTEKTVTLTVASTATLDFSASAPAPAGTTGTTTTLGGVSVTATTLTEVKTSEIGTNVSLHQINTVPQITRNFLEFADTVPGMVFTIDSNGNTSLRGGGMNNSSTNVYIDGVGQKSYVKEGGVSGQIGTQGNPFPQLAIGEYKVITSNYKAEYDQISSAAVTAETKSGTNELHGDVFGSYTGDQYRSSTPAELASGKKAQSHEKEYGFDIGGPIIQDAMHFYFAYEAKNFSTPIDVTLGSHPESLPFLPASVQAQLGPSNLPFTEDLYFGKIDWEFSDRDRIELSSKVRKENQDGGYGTGTAQSAGYQTKNNDTRVDLRWQHSADSWFNDLLFTWEKAFNAPVAFNGGNGQVYNWLPAGTDNQTIFAVGAASPLATQNKGQKGPGIQDDLTFNNLSWMGDHTVKMGVKYKEVTLASQDTGDASAQFFYEVDPTGTAALPYKAFFASPSSLPGLTPIITTKDKQFGWYIQDDWVVNDHLTLNLGVRWDIEHNPSYLDFVTPPSIVAAFNAQDPNAPAGQTYAQSLAKGGININDYISNGHNRKAYDNEWQPRLGFSYDLNGDEEHVIIGGAGRAYDRDLYDYLQLEQTKIALGQFNYYFQDSSGHCVGTPCIPWDPKYLTGVGTLQALTAVNGGGEIDVMNNNLKPPHSDQFSLGMRNKLGDWNTSATVSRLIYKDGFAFTLGNRYPDGNFWINGSQPWGNGVPGFGSLIVGNNGIENRTTELLLSAEKPYTKESGWGATIAYTYADASQNRDINEHYSFDRATIGDYPFITSNAVAKHRLVATGTIDGPWDITYSGKLTLATPIPYDGFIFPSGPFAPGQPSNIPVAATPPGQSFLFGGKVFGYRSIDLSANKHFDLTHGIDWYIRLDAINIFNYKNYDPGGGATSIPNQTPVIAVVNRDGNIVGVPRTLKFTMGVKW